MLGVGGLNPFCTTLLSGCHHPARPCWRRIISACASGPLYGDPGSLSPHVLAAFSNAAITRAGRCQSVIVHLPSATWAQRSADLAPAEAIIKLH